MSEIMKALARTKDLAESRERMGGVIVDAIRRILETEGRERAIEEVLRFDAAHAFPWRGTLPPLQADVAGVLFEVERRAKENTPPFTTG